MATGHSRESNDATLSASVPLPDGFRVRPGLTRDRARKAYRNRVILAELALLLLTVLLWFASLSELKYAFHTSYVGTTGSVAYDSFGPTGPTLAIEYDDQSGSLQYAELDAPQSKGAFVGEHIPIWYDSSRTCNDVLYPTNEHTSDVIADSVVFFGVPVLAAGLLLWHSRRWRRRVEQAAATPAVGNVDVRWSTSKSRRPVVTLSGGRHRQLYLSLLSGQLARIVQDVGSLQVRGSIEPGGIVVLTEPGSPMAIWPAGRLRSRPWLLDRHDVGRLLHLAAPMTLILLYHVTAAQHGC